ncbi:MAG: amino acid adenylation domain-containing protein [Candidatus Sulfotelmatobacter sp.]
MSSIEFGITPDTSCADYWQVRLADVSVLELPTDRQRPAILGQRMELESSCLPDNLNSGMRRIGADAGVEVSTVTLGVFAVMLHRYTAQEKFAVGVVLGSRLLPITVDFSGRPSFRNLLQRMEAATSTGSTVGGVPAELSAKLGRDADRSRHPIYQAGFSAERNGAPSPTVETPGLDLTFQLTLSHDASFHIYYNRDLFERETAARMLGHLQTLLSGVIENSDRSAAEMPMLTERELHELLVERNQTSRDFPTGCLHEHVENVAANTPEQIAVIHAREQLSYGELNARANQLAHYLRKRGIGCNSRVGICLERSLDFAIALIGVLKAGGSCVPLDPKYPAERLAYMMEDVAASMVLTERGLLRAVVPAGTQIVFVSEERERILAEDRSNPSPASSPSDIAYVIYTSGSTGRPRGVLLPHAGLVNYTLAAAEQFELRPSDRILQFCSISFDAALEEIYSTWAAGAALVFRKDDVSLEPGEFLRWVSEQHVTVVDLPTAFWHEWVYALPELSEKVPPTLRLVIVGGEKASPEAYSTWHKFVGNRVRWVNTYGPAEASVVATAYEPKPRADQELPAQLPIGRPVANTKVYLLDSDLNPVPVGVPGEIHIGGVGVAKGYLNLPQLTQEKFIRDIFSDDPSARMYKTGDLAKYLPNGEIEFVGRRDNQVKIRGFRVEPGEIESVLSKHSGLQENAIVVRQDSTGNKRLVAYVVRSEALGDSELRRHVKAHLPEYMVPSEFVFLDSMPLTPNGKIDRRALAALKSDSAAVTAPATPVDDPLQAQLIAIWEELLGRKPIGIRDNFFDLGGHSLLAARLMHRIKQIHGQSLPLAILLQASTVEKLASAIRGDFSEHWSSLVTIQPEGSKPPFFCVHGVGGNVVGFHELAKRMKPDFPFYGLQSQGLDGKSDLLTTIESMAAHYLKEIRGVQPNGPYHLGGFSMGGLVAYEMAQQLVAAGEEVGLVALFDTYATAPKSVNESLRDLLFHPTWTHVKRLPAELRKKVRRTWNGMRLPEYLKKVMRTNARAADHYVLRPYEGKTILLRAGDTWRVADDPYAAWTQYVAELETIQIRGTHMEILREPNVSTLAERLKNCIHGASDLSDKPELLATNA